jgi:hypothetical protein
MRHPRARIRVGVTLGGLALMVFTAGVAGRGQATTPASPIPETPLGGLAYRMIGPHR